MRTCRGIHRRVLSKAPVFGLCTLLVIRETRSTLIAEETILCELRESRSRFSLTTKGHPASDYRIIFVYLPKQHKRSFTTHTTHSAAHLNNCPTRQTVIAERTAYAAYDGDVFTDAKPRKVGNS